MLPLPVLICSCPLEGFSLDLPFDLDLNPDAYQVGGAKVRLFGLDAPESKQLCRDAGGREYACGKCLTGSHHDYE